MAKAMDKKVVRETKDLLLRTLGNLLESHRERKFTYSQRAKPLTRKLFCTRKELEESNVTYIETGRFLQLDFDRLRIYLATTYGRNDRDFVNSARKVYDGLKEIENLLKLL